MLTVIWTVYFFLYIGAAKHRITLIPIDVKYYPLALALTLIVIVIFPFHIFHLSARLTLLKVLGNLLITPFGKADFRECFVADILTSMVIPITDTMYMFCYFFSINLMQIIQHVNLILLFFFRSTYNFCRNNCWRTF